MSAPLPLAPSIVPRPAPPTGDPTDYDLGSSVVAPSHAPPSPGSLSLSSSRFVAFIFRNARAYSPNGSHIGLGVNAMHMVRSLKAIGVATEAYAAFEIDDLTAVLAKLPADSIVIIEAFWVVTDNVCKLLAAFPHMTFVVRCHSQVGFLQVEPAAIGLLREQLALQDTAHRFHVAGNSSRFASFCRQAYRTDCLYLPNLYDTDRVSRKPWAPHAGRLLRVGSFGAVRILKMHVVAAAAALVLARKRGVDLEFHLTVGREEGGGPVVDAIRRMYANVPGVRLVEETWSNWHGFRQIVGSMDLCLQLSATESFNLVTADAIAEGTPSVVGPAIDWVPSEWQAEIDDIDDVVAKSMRVLNDAGAQTKGLAALKRYNEGAAQEWREFLAGQQHPRPTPSPNPRPKMMAMATEELPQVTGGPGASPPTGQPSAEAAIPAPNPTGVSPLGQQTVVATGQVGQTGQASQSPRSISLPCEILDESRPAPSRAPQAPQQQSQASQASQSPPASLPRQPSDSAGTGAGIGSTPGIGRVGGGGSTRTGDRPRSQGSGLLRGALFTIALAIPVGLGVGAYFVNRMNDARSKAVPALKPVGPVPGPVVPVKPVGPVIESTPTGDPDSELTPAPAPVIPDTPAYLAALKFRSAISRSYRSAATRLGHHELTVDQLGVDLTTSWAAEATALSDLLKESKEPGVVASEIARAFDSP